MFLRVVRTDADGVDRVERVERRADGLYRVGLDGDEQGPFADWRQLTATGARPLILTVDDTAVQIDSDELDEEEIAALIEIPANQDLDDRERADWPPAHFLSDPSFASYQIGLTINGATWILVRSFDVEDAFLVPADLESRPEYEQVGEISWFGAGWSDATSERIERWRDVCFFSGPHFESGDTDRVFRDGRPSSELFEYLLDQSEAWGQDALFSLSITSPHVPTETVLELVPGPLPGEDGDLGEITINGTRCRWTGQRWKVEAPHEASTGSGGGSGEPDST